MNDATILLEKSSRKHGQTIVLCHVPGERQTFATLVKIERNHMTAHLYVQGEYFDGSIQGLNDALSSFAGRS